MLDEKSLKRQILLANRRGEAFAFPSGSLLAARFPGILLDKTVMSRVNMASADLRFASLVGSALSHLDLSHCRAQEAGLARAEAMREDTTAARSAYETFFRLWNDADPALAPLRDARSEYARLR